DKRGHGLSGLPAGRFSMDDLVGDIESLMDHHGLNDAIFVGLSVGGIIAQGLWAKRPDLIRALVLSDTANVIGPKEIWDQRIEAITKGGIEPMGDAVMERWFSPGFRTSRTAELAGYRNMLVRTSADGYVGVSAAIRDADMTESTRNINIPTLCIVGSDDGATTPAMVRTLAGLIDGARLEVIDGVGHLPCLEQPEIMAGLIEGFLKENKLV
ncbi:MAG: alpha/beta fold hydrolase, partial [Rhodospirillales bacterium]